MATPFAQKVIDILQTYCDTNHSGNVRSAAKDLGIDPDTGYFSRWLKCFDQDAKTKRVPRIDSIGPCLDKIGVKIIAPWEETTSAQSSAELTPRAENDALAKENSALRAQLDALRLEHAKSLGQVELLKEQLANAQRTAMSNCVTQTVNGDKNRAVINAENKEG